MLCKRVPLYFDILYLGGYTYTARYLHVISIDMNLKLPQPTSPEVETPVRTYTQQEIEQLLADAQKWSIDKEELIAALAYLAREVYQTENNDTSSEKHSTVVEQEKNKAQLSQLLKNTPTVVNKARATIEDQLRAADDEYIWKYVLNTPSIEEKCVWLNIIAQRQKKNLGEFTPSKTNPEELVYMGKSWYPIEFIMVRSGSYNMHTISLRLVGIDEKANFSFFSIKEFFWLLHKIDVVFLKTKGQAPLHPRTPFKAVDWIVSTPIYFVLKQQNVFKKQKKIRLPKMLGSIDTRDDHKRMVDYLNNHRRIHNADIYSEESSSDQPPVSSPTPNNENEQLMLV